ncbi:MAG: FimV/HubP family polar landmark protein [Gammaproteobacteria bacterium]
MKRRRFTLFCKGMLIPFLVVVYLQAVAAPAMLPTPQYTVISPSQTVSMNSPNRVATEASVLSEALKQPAPPPSAPSKRWNNFGMLLIAGIGLMILSVLLLLGLFLWPSKKTTLRPLPPAEKAPDEEDELELPPPAFPLPLEETAPEPEPEEERPAAIATPEVVAEEVEVEEEDEDEDEDSYVEGEEDYAQKVEKITTGTTAAPPEEGFEFMENNEAVRVKLDLARAYLEMGDYEAVKETLEWVFQEGSEPERNEADLLLEQAKLAEDDS